MAVPVEGQSPTAKVVPLIEVPAPSGGLDTMIWSRVSDITAMIASASCGASGPLTSGSPITTERDSRVSKLSPAEGAPLAWAAADTIAGSGDRRNDLSQPF